MGQTRGRGGVVKKVLFKTSQNDTENICMQYVDDLMYFSVETDRHLNKKESHQPLTKQEG